MIVPLLNMNDLFFAPQVVAWENSNILITDNITNNSKWVLYGKTISQSLDHASITFKANSYTIFVLT